MIGMGQSADVPAVLVYGTGSIGLQHLRALSGLASVRPVAMPVRGHRVPELVAAGFETVLSVEEIRDANIAGIIVATDTARHAADAARMLGLGRVLIEKPLADSLRGVAEIHAAAAGNTGDLFVGYCLRFDMGLRRFRERLPEVGRIHAVRIECQSYLPNWRPGVDHRVSYSARAGEGGVLRDLSHELDYAVWLFGKPEALWARVHHTRALDIETEDVADVYWDTAAGFGVSIHLDYLSPAPTRTMRVSGAEGELLWDGMAGTVQWRGADGQRKIENFEFGPAASHRRLTDQARAFVAGGDGVLATFHDGQTAVEIVEAAIRSSDSGQVERVGGDAR